MHAGIEYITMPSCIEPPTNKDEIEEQVCDVATRIIYLVMPVVTEEEKDSTGTQDDDIEEGTG